MCVFDGPKIPQQKEAVKPATEELKPMASPERESGDDATTGAIRKARARTGLRIDLANSTGSGLNIPEA